MTLVKIRQIADLLLRSKKPNIQVLYLVKFLKELREESGFKRFLTFDIYPGADPGGHRGHVPP